MVGTLWLTFTVKRDGYTGNKATVRHFGSGAPMRVAKPQRGLEKKNTLVC